MRGSKDWRSVGGGGDGVDGVGGESGAGDGGGEGWIWRGRAGGGLEGAAATEAVVEAKVAWCRAALTLAFSFFAGPR